MAPPPALIELQQSLQALHDQLHQNATEAIAPGLALCQNFATHRHRYLPAAWLPPPPASPTEPHRESPSDPHPANPVNASVSSNVKNAAEKGCATDNLSTAPISTAPEEQMLSHYVELTKHMRLLAADFSMLRAARNPSTQKSRRQQIHQRVATLLAYCQALSGTSPKNAPSPPEGRAALN